jgi:hypothetical protein
MLMPMIRLNRVVRGQLRGITSFITTSFLRIIPTTQTNAFRAGHVPSGSTGFSSPRRGLEIK